MNTFEIIITIVLSIIFIPMTISNIISIIKDIKKYGTNDYDRKEILKFFGIIGLIIAFTIISITSEKRGKEEGYDLGYEEGCDQGYQNGYSDGQSDAEFEFDDDFDRIYDDAYNDGYSDGYEYGWEWGFEAGYDNGKADYMN